VFGCAETNIAWNKPKRKYAQQMIQINTKQANLSVRSSTEMGISDYQSGGVCNCITGRWTGRIKESVTDPSGLGRWAGHILYGKKRQQHCHHHSVQTSKSQRLSNIVPTAMADTSTSKHSKSRPAKNPST
jgi:hypothetical protein